MPTPMPTIAVSRFIPAASSEPKVSTRTRTATPTPMNSVAPIATPVVPNALPPTATSRPASSAAAVVSCSASRLVSSSCSRGTSYWTVASAAPPSGVTAWLSKGLTAEATCGARPASATTCSIAAATAGSVTVWPSGATKTIWAPTPAAPGEAASSWSSASCDSDPGIVNSSSNELPRVSSSATTAPRTASQATETSPRWRKEARPSRASREAMREEVSGISRWVGRRRSAAAGGLCARGRGSRGRPGAPRGSG